jgi:hypothetical protein
MSRSPAVHGILVAVSAAFVVCCVVQIFVAGLGVFESGRASSGVDDAPDGKVA